MAHGIQIFDSAGNLRIDSTHRMLRAHSHIHKATNSVQGQSSFYPVAGMTNDGTWYVCTVALTTVLRIDDGGFTALETMSGNRTMFMIFRT
jgi:hypothetical protein